MQPDLLQLAVTRAGYDISAPEILQLATLASEIESEELARAVLDARNRNVRRPGSVNVTTDIVALAETDRILERDFGLAPPPEPDRGPTPGPPYLGRSTSSD